MDAVPIHDVSKPVWLITGCSTGFGRELAGLALRCGHRVVATARDIARLGDLVADYPTIAIALALDVTNGLQTTRAVATAERAFGRIDVLVNNAGYGYLAAVEEGEDEEIRAMFETNLFGLVALTKAVLPGMRARRHGHIINISSVGGLVGNPGSGYYNATKFAVEGLSEALAKEVEPLGIRVTAVEPGPFRTDWAGRSLKQTRQPIAAYAETAGARRAQVSGRSGKQPGDPARAAAAIMQIVGAPKPPRHLVLGRPALDIIRTKLSDLAGEIDEWAATTLGADFPKP
jgi:NAD(P)-dependent dehydrogenase (short-subunit alcohol dehydrogenase family)